MKVVYIAGKFRAPTPWQVELNIRRAEHMALFVAEHGLMPLCPHTMTRIFDKLLPDEFWLTGTLELLGRCDAMILCEGWQESAGTIAEIAYMQKLGRPVLHSPADLRRWVLALFPNAEPDLWGDRVAMVPVGDAFQAAKAQGATEALAAIGAIINASNATNESASELLMRIVEHVDGESADEPADAPAPPLLSTTADLAPEPAQR